MVFPILEHAMIDLTAPKNESYGEALVSRGLFVRDAVNGYGAVTFMQNGFLWQFYDIWLDTDKEDNVSTSWSNVSTPSTTWTSPADPL